ncbi:hypothetical protein FHG87_015861 [Trinorchestia longiramus]|nr:hypothetical protein FHG87_015861 [Trinorchestia longiramus]
MKLNRKLVFRQQRSIYKKLNECGNTIRIPNLVQFDHMLSFSHEGFACTYYPSEATDECTVTFESEDPAGFTFVLQPYFPEHGDRCTGFNMTITESTLHCNQTEIINACTPAGVIYALTITQSENPARNPYVEVRKGIRWNVRGREGGEKRSEGTKVGERGREELRGGKRRRERREELGRMRVGKRSHHLAYYDLVVLR